MHADFQIWLFGYDRSDTASANWIWRASHGGGLAVSIVSAKYSDLSEGRCDACEVTIVGTKVDLDAMGVDVDQEVRIFVQGESESAASTRYYGYIKEIEQGVGTHDRMKRTLIIGGLMEQLDDVLAFRFYNNCFIGRGTGPFEGLIENLLTEVIIGESNVNITNSFTEIDGCYTMITTADFPDVSVAEAIARLADVRGGVVYGIDDRATLYFKERTTLYTQSFQIGQDGVKVIRLNKSNENVKNSFIVRCKTLMAGGELVFEVADSRLPSHPHTRIRQLAVNTPEFSDNTGAIDYGEALVEKLADPSEPIRLEIADFSDPMYPYELVKLSDENGVSYGSFPIKALHWDISSKKCGLTVELGEVEPDMSSQARSLLRLQRIGASREFSNNIELSGARYAWVIETRRDYSNQFQTRNFWGAQTDDDESMDLPDIDDTTDDLYPVFEDGVKAVCGVPIPKDKDENYVDSTVVESKNIEVGITRNYVALSADIKFREIYWQNGEFKKYCRIHDYGGGAAVGGNFAHFKEAFWIYPERWGSNPLPSSGNSDSFFWYEAVMSFNTDLTIYLMHLQDLSASSPAEQFHIYFAASINAGGSTPPEDNCGHVEFTNNAGTLECRVWEEYLGVSTQRYLGSVSMASLSPSTGFKVVIDRYSPDPTRTTVKVYKNNTVIGGWIEIFNSGGVQIPQRTKSFWGARWNMNSSSYYGAANVQVFLCKFSGGNPLLSVSKNQGADWQNCAYGVLTDISSLPAIAPPTLKMKMALTHYTLVKGWCMAFK